MNRNNYAANSTEENMGKACLFIVSGPSGVGKDSVIAEVRKMDAVLKKVVTCASRKAREGEEEGVDYYFRSVDWFEAEDGKELVEHSIVHSNHYGIMRSEIERKSRDGAILVIDWQGFLKIKEAFREEKNMLVYGIFVLPPSLEYLKIRLESRGTDDSLVIKRRLDAAEKEIEQAVYYNVAFVNQNNRLRETAENVLNKINYVRDLWKGGDFAKEELEGAWHCQKRSAAL
jgi:guanylate kinase